MPVEVLVLVEVPVVQQGLPGPPQLPALQLPLLQVPGIGAQLLPFATQTLDTQQPLSWHALPEQQSCPGPPHAVPVTTAPPAPEPPLPAPPAPTLPPLPVGVLALPPEPPPPAGTMPPPPSPSPPVPGSKTPLSVPLLELLQPPATTSRAAMATAKNEWADEARLCWVMDKLLERRRWRKPRDYMCLPEDRKLVESQGSGRSVMPPFLTDRIFLGQ